MLKPWMNQTTWKGFKFTKACQAKNESSNETTTKESGDTLKEKLAKLWILFLLKMQVEDPRIKCYALLSFKT